MYNSYVLNNANMHPSRFPSTSTDDVTRRLSSFTSSASVHQQQQFLQTLSSSLDGPLSPQHPTDVTSMSSRLYYDSVQLNHVTQQHADVLRCDVIAEPIKHFNAEYSTNQDAERTEINDFLRVHYLRIAQGCRDVPVKELRHIIPILILSCFSMKGEQAQKKVKGLWERPPQGWPADVPYCDPNNAPIRSRAGQPAGTKPKKEILNLMFDFLIHEYTRQHGAYTANRVARNSVPSSMPIRIGQEVSHVTSSLSSSWPMASSPTRATQQQQAGHWLRQTFPPVSTIQSRLASGSLPRSHFNQSQTGYNYHVTQAEMLQRHHHQTFAQTTLKRARPFSEDVDNEEMQLSTSPSNNLLASQNSSIVSTFYPAATPTLTLKRSNSYDEASSTFSEDASRSRSSSSSSSKDSMPDHSPSHIYYRSSAAITAVAAGEVKIPVSTKQPSPQLQLSQQQQRELSVNNNLSQNISSHVPESNISSRLSPVTYQQQQPASNYPMTKKARLLAAVAASSSSSPPSPNDVTNRLSPPVTSCSPSLPPAHLSTCPSPSRDQQAIDDVMARIVDKMRALEERHLTGERFGIVLTTKDLLWRMRPLVDSSRYVAYMDKLAEFDLTLDAIGVMGKLTESHYSKWQEFEDKWYIKVCGHTTYDVSDQEVATSYAHT